MSRQLKDSGAFEEPAQRLHRRLCGNLPFRSETLEIWCCELKADYTALKSDGQYWCSIFSGGLAFGAVQCAPSLFVAFRLAMAGATATIFYFELRDFPPHGGYFLLYFESWVIILQSAYFILASVLTIIATYARGGIVSSTPIVVRLVEIGYAILLPATLVSALNTLCVLYAQPRHCVSAIEQYNFQNVGWHAVAYTWSLFGIIVLDAIFNRQSYYANFHAIIGMAFCCALAIMTSQHTQHPESVPWRRVGCFSRLRLTTPSSRTPPSHDLTPSSSAARGRAAQRCVVHVYLQTGMLPSLRFMRPRVAPIFGRSPTFIGASTGHCRSLAAVLPTVSTESSNKLFEPAKPT